MKGIILAGGRGTRLLPITKVISKHLLPVAGKPVIYYPIETLKSIGIKDILLICGPEHTAQYVDVLGSGKELGVNFSYTIQHEPIGIAHGLSLARSFAEGQKIAFILGDNIFGDAKAEGEGDNDGDSMVTLVSGVFVTNGVGDTDVFVTFGFGVTMMSLMFALSTTLPFVLIPIKITDVNMAPVSKIKKTTPYQLFRLVSKLFKVV